MHQDLQEEVQKVAQNFPYLAVVTGNTSVQVFVIAERLVLTESFSFVKAILSLISAFFVFNVEYPKPLYPVCILLQHYIFCIKDDQPVPQSLVRFISSLDKLE